MVSASSEPSAENAAAVVQPDAAVTTGVATSRIAEIIRHELAAAELYAEGDAHQWEAARLIAEELEGGTSQVKLAGQIGKSQGHVSKCARIWREYSLENNRPAWKDAYAAVSSRPMPAVGPTPSPEQEPEDEVYGASPVNAAPPPDGAPTDDELLAGTYWTPAPDPPMTREAAEACTSAMRHGYLMTRLALRAGLISGIPPIDAARMLGALQRRWERSWEQNGMPREDVDATSRILLRPMMDAVLAWPAEDLLLPKWADDSPSYEPGTDEEEAEVHTALRRLYDEWFELAGPGR